ncbi:MAG TPA: phosphoenolpyruvate synthase [Candidatus Baltobacteraceae bacterium]|jgi:pyruvate,water dikinase|nr:phosphoenolpyruvate synthase [Candidatus Baltobacteraceae bacterium]
MAIASGLKFVRSFDTIRADDVASVGGKNASLGELYSQLRPEGIPVPDGFAVTADAYRYVLTANDAWEPLHALLDDIDPADMQDFEKRAERAHALVAGLEIPRDLQAEVIAAYRSLIDEYGPDLSVAVRSSATAEDLPSASFAGQHESFLNVRGEEQVVQAYSRCLASLFMGRAIHYRIDQGFDHFRVGLSVGVVKMVRSDLAAAGVAFTLDTESGFRDVVFINASYGLAENVVQGNVDPDEFYVFKPAFEAGYRQVLSRRIGSKTVKLVYAQGSFEPGTSTRNIPAEPSEQRVACISDVDVLNIAEYAIAVEKHYSALNGRAVPMDLEWAKDGLDGKIYLVQARPETVASQKPTERASFDEYRFDGPLPAPVVTGRAVGRKVAVGRARVVRGVDELHLVQPGDVLVAATTSPDWEPAMKIASAIVAERGGRTCHAAIVARELGIPAVVGAAGAMAKLGQSSVTVSCAQGETGAVYSGQLAYRLETFDASALPAPPVEIMMTIGSPDAAFEARAIPNSGVGLARMEFIISNDIKAHPMALAHPERVTDPAVRSELETLCAGYRSMPDFFIQRLSEGVATIAAAFYPKPVVVRMSDFKTNEYAALLGGKDFEPLEDNPMLGFRGASRYTHPAYADGFELECAAMKRVRGDMGLTNVVLMIPFCRRIEEAKRVLEKMAELGLRRGEAGLEIYVMCEIPNNVIQIDAFAQLFDGFSIGSNDLTQLTLGVDRDSEIVSFDYDERDPGVLEMIRLTIEGAKRNRRHVGICGQAPSDYPEVAVALVGMGIESMSLNPDSVLRTRVRLSSANLK